MYDEESVAERPVVPMDNKRSGGVKESNRFSDSSSGDSHLRRKGHDADEARSRSSHSDPSINLEEQDYAHGDSKLVSCLRLIMLFVLVASAVGTALAVHHFTSKAEREAFDASFELDAANILESMGSALFLWLGTMDAYATHAVSAARATNQTWPFVSVPDGAVHMAKLRSLGKALIIHQTPLVTREQRADWERYTASNHQWAWDAVRVQPEDKNYQGATYDDVYSERSPTIGDFSGIAPYADQYLPTWQSSPFVPAIGPYNGNALAWAAVRDSVPELQDALRPVISPVLNMPQSDSESSVFESTAASEYAKFFVRKDDVPSEPLTALFYPIVDTMADHVSLFNEKTGAPTGEHRMVGVLHQFYYWRDLLSGILLKGNEGLVCVIENPCNQTFTYEWKGQDVIYLGRGDLHDPKYERMHQSMKFEDFASQSSTGRQYTGSPLGGGACPYTLHIYSGSKREAEFITNQPKIFTVAVVLIFAFTSAMFILYDQCVERRQRKIMYTAARSNANVALLEQMVRERTKKLQETNRCLEEANRRVVRASAAQLEHFACMSHEIRTPLNCIIGLSSLLLDTELQPMQEESMRMIVTSGDLLLTVVNDVLDYSKLESGNVEINVIRSNLQETLNNIVQSMETRGQPKKLAIRTKYDPAISEYVYMDYRRVQQILFNLLSNAIKFSFEGGVIELSAVLARESDSNALTSAAADDKNPQESSPNEGNVLRFIVKDYGRGIEKKDFETIFQPFRQASAETERVYGGTGLGLAVTSRLIKSLGGRINVDSQEGEWSQFTVDLPFQDAPVDVSLLSNRLENTTVLLFDDDSENVAAMTQVFRRCSLSFFLFTSMSEMEKLLTGAGSLSPSRRYICLVHENLYDAAAVRQLEMHAPYVLLSHGPKYAVKESKGHYRSLTNVLPSILLESFAASMDQVSTIVRRPSAELRVRHSAKLPSGGGNVGDLRILIAEDNKINQKVLLRILKRLHYENVDVVDDGKQACDKELEKEYDVILMDIQMPVMNGIEACRIIMGRGSGDGVEDHKEEADSRPKPRIIFVTAHVADVFEAECREAGGVDFLPKPFNIGDIENCLQRNAQAPVLSSSFVDA